MGVIENLLAVIVVLGLLITFHEYGHFWVARRCGVKVLRFSVGFGKPLWSRVDRHGTEFAVAAIPLGGYVKMLDEREGPVAPEEQAQAFNRKSVWARIAIVSAGPAANFLLAFVAYWALFVYGTTTVAPVIGDIAADSPAARGGLQSGQEIVAVEGERTPSWGEVNLKLVAAIGANGELEVTTRESETASPERHRVPVSDWLVRQDPPRPLATLGVTPWRPDLPAVLGEVLGDGRAQQAGLQSGDRIVSVDGVAVEDWMAFVERVRDNPGTTLALRVERDGERRDVMLTPATREQEDGTAIGYIGVGVQTTEWPERYRREIRYGPLDAVGEAVSKTGEMSLLTLDSIRKMLVGLISPSNLSGPVTIARIAGDSARNGVESFISFLAYLSISLGVLNLLPIPVLDGGHLVYYLIEAVRGRPVPEAVQAFGLRIGVALVGSLMLMALYFDLMRL
ncbi:sigma E protease regulator RseP [Chromohalobacter canadensis]|uniref:Zinc metalloprotease n=1 Tax=Chromohalobacter canadensis TaxID=141389 RepID=A0A285VR57_9GAMM|nr:sigma E protease regulator RseP [Chromohalobacter canadensis]MCT8467078.1 sigma E protease regulator RseP [Chromohalobacter canadensis]MCT8471174.1 sigma E protease regulator RseP [Chromohalobacter canadensis]MCT8497575.1 sigma E protease regulator RseP [Chromohalobacter canadensis]SOC56560.1 site-2 protease. Metallo peptidase. MEROPS family M50B [Chromohalobacter canadensis]